MSETATEKANAAIQTVEEYARNEIWPQVEKYIVAGDRERLAQGGPVAEAAIRAAFKRAEEAEVLDTALTIACRYLSAVSADYGQSPSCRRRVLAEAAQQAKEGEADASIEGP